MRKTTNIRLLGALIMLGASALAAPPYAAASHRAPAIPVDPLDAKVIARPGKPEQLPTQKPDTRLHKRIKSRESSQSETLTFTGAFQSFHEYYEFNYAGGDFLSYDVTITLDGESAIISNLLNLVDGYPYDYSTQEDIHGVYDPEAKTITIPTPTEFDKATPVGYVYGSYPLTLVSGTVDAQGGLTPSDELVITLSEDHTRAVFNQHFGGRLYTQTGDPQGFKVIYKGGLMKTDLSEPENVCFTDAMDFGACFVNEITTCGLKIFNLSEYAGTAGISVEGDQFDTTSLSVALEPMATAALEMAFSPTAQGIHHGEVLIGGTHKVVLTGEGIEMPDFSYIVKSGDMEFHTDAKYPFSRTERDGIAMARSNIEKVNNCDSYLTASFTVPEGHLGVFSWKGWSNSEISYAALPSVMADGKPVFDYAGLLNKDISGNYTFGPGRHEVTFDYLVGWASYVTENDYMCVYDLDLDIKGLADHDATLLTDKVVFPNSLLSGDMVSKEAYISIRNEGAEPLEVTDLSLPEWIKAEIPGSAATLEVTEIPLTFSASAAGTYEGDVRIATNAGDFTVACSALVREMPDFQSIVAEGDFSFTTDEQNPFLVEDGKARNSTAKIPDTEVTQSSMTASFEVPEGKLGILSWKGRVSCASTGDMGWTDYLSLVVSNPSGTHYNVIPGEYDLSTDLYPYIEAPDMSDLLCPPGWGYVTFNYVQYGDGTYQGDDMAEIYDLSLRLVDAEAESAVLLTEEIEFPEIYEGKESAAVASLLNTGTEDLEVYEVVGDGIFEGTVPSMSVPYNQKLDVRLSFSPLSEGFHEGEVTIVTSAGDFTVRCTGNAISTAGMLLTEDFEDDAAGWSIYDRDGDGDGWNLAWNVYGGVPQGHVHSGAECIVSFSWDYVSGSFTPDNWTFSPSFEVPQEGAFLTWYVAGDDNSRAGDIYSVYAAEGDYEHAFSMDDYELLLTDEIVSDEWTMRVVDLAAFAGKNIHVAFRHHDSEGFYMVKIDDVFVYIENPVKVEMPEASKTVENVQYYSIDGTRIQRPEQGIVIVKTIYSDGTVTAGKAMIE